RAHRIHQNRMRVAEGVHGDTGQEVEVALAVGVPDDAALATFEQRERRAGGAHHRVAESLAPVLRRVGVDGGDMRFGYHFSAFTGGDGTGSVLSDSITSVPITSVPITLALKASRSIECGMRPSMTAAEPTPPRTASRHAVIFGIMPDSRDGMRASSSVAVMRATSESRFGQSLYSPATSVRMTSRCAPSAMASADAAESAFTLSECAGSSRSGAIDE